MDSTTQISVRERLRLSFAERGAGFVFAVAVEVLIALLFLFALVPALTPKPKPEPPLFGFDVRGGETPEPTVKAEAKARARPRGDEAEKAPVVTPVEPAEKPEFVTPEPPVKSNVLWLTRPDYAAADIGRSRSRSSEAASTGTDPARRTAGDSQIAEGKGPNGETLYEAEWYRLPRDSEIDPYIPDRARGRGSGWGDIACRTASNYRVEDCVEKGEFPRGSGLAGAARQMAWQFKMKPPRLGGKAMIGEWVSIRFYYRETRARP